MVLMRALDLLILIINRGMVGKEPVLTKGPVLESFSMTLVAVTLHKTTGCPDGSLGSFIWFPHLLLNK